MNKSFVESMFFIIFNNFPFSKAILQKFWKVQKHTTFF